MSNSEKITDYLMISTFKQIFGFEYFTSLQSTNNQNEHSKYKNIYTKYKNLYTNLFQRQIPDGFIIFPLNNQQQQILLIIENKKSIKQREEGLLQLQRYYKQAITFIQKSDLSLCIYFVLGMGNNSQEFRYEIFEPQNNQLQQDSDNQNVNLRKSHIQSLHLIKLMIDNNAMDKFSRSINLQSQIQSTHNYIVRELHLDNNNEQCYLVCLILIAFKQKSFISELFDESTHQLRSFVSNASLKKIFKEVYLSFGDTCFNEVFSFVDNIVGDIYGLVKIFTTILDQHFDVVSVLYAQFCKYSKCEDELNIVLTPEWVIQLMYSLIRQNTSNTKNELTIYDPCCGSGRLLLPFLHTSRSSLYGTEINKKMYVLVKCNSIINNLNINLSFGDCLQSDFKDKFDISMMNPPYTKKLSKHHYWEFILKQVQTLKANGIGCVICPSGGFMQKDENIPFKQKFLSACVPLYTVNLGTGVFKGVGVSCSILVYRKSIPTKDFQIKVFDFQNTQNKYYKHVPHVGLQITELGKQRLQEISHLQNYDLINISQHDIHVQSKISWIDTQIQTLPSSQTLQTQQAQHQEHIKKLLIKSKEQELKNYYQKLIEQQLQEYETHIRELQLNQLSLSELSLGEIFVLQSKLKDVPQYKSSDCKISSKDNCIKFIGASKNNNGIIGYVPLCQYKASEENPLYTIIKNGDGAAGYVFKQIEPFSTSSSVMVCSLQNITQQKLIDQNLSLISEQLHERFNFANSLTYKKLSNVKVFVQMD